MKIIQIIPSNGWAADFTHRERSKPLLCWALVQVENGSTEIRGVIALNNGEKVFAEDEKNFCGFSETE